MASKRTRSSRSQKIAKRQSARRPSRTSKAPSERQLAADYLRGRIAQYELDTQALRSLLSTVEGTSGPASAASAVLKAARRAGWQP